MPEAEPPVARPAVPHVAAAAPLVASVRYVASGARIAGVTATQQTVAGTGETWLLDPLPSKLTPRAGDTFRPMGTADRRTRTVTAVSPGANGAHALTCSVPAE